MLFLRLSRSLDLLTDLAVPEVYSGLLWTGQGDEFPADKRVTCIGVSADGRVLTVRVGVGNPIPLFFGWDPDGCFVLSDSCAAAWKAIHGSESIGTEHLDRTAVVETLLFDGPLASRTLLTNVKKFQMGELAFVDILNQTVEVQWDWLPSIQSGSFSETDALEMAKKHILRLSETFSDHSSALLPLTGGLDSRLLAGLARHEKKIELASYTFQRGPSLETWCAKKVAKNLNVSHASVDLPAKACYQKFAQHVVAKTAGMISGMHCHGIYSCERCISDNMQSLPRVFGYFGDPVTGAMTDDESTREQLDSPQSVLKKYEICIFPELVQRYRTEIISDLRGSYEAFLASGSQPGTFHEFWKIQQRQSNLITHLFSYHRSEHRVKVVLPFLDVQFIDFFLSLPYGLRRNRALFKAACKEIYPDLFKLPSMHFKPGSFLSCAEVVFEKLESGFNRMNPAQEWFLSPFKYEQHEKTLFSHLASDVQQGIDILCEMENVEKRAVQFPVWKHSTPKEYYRLAALKYLVDGPDPKSGDSDG